MEVDDRLLLPVLQPEIPRNPTVVFVHLAIPFPPAVELAAPDAEPLHEPPGADLGLLRPAPDEIHDLIPRVVRHPDSGQISPTLFFKATCSAISSASTSFLVWIFFSRYSIRSCWAWRRREWQRDNQPIQRARASAASRSSTASRV